MDWISTRCEKDSRYYQVYLEQDRFGGVLIFTSGGVRESSWGAW